MIGRIRPQDKVMAMDRSTIWPYFPRFLIARPQFLRFWRACTAFKGLNSITRQDVRGQLIGVIMAIKIYSTSGASAGIGFSFNLQSTFILLVILLGAK